MRRNLVVLFVVGLLIASLGITSYSQGTEAAEPNGEYSWTIAPGPIPFDTLFHTIHVVTYFIEVPAYDREIQFTYSLKSYGLDEADTTKVGWGPTVPTSTGTYNEIVVGVGIAVGDENEAATMEGGVIKAYAPVASTAAEGQVPYSVPSPVTSSLTAQQRIRLPWRDQGLAFRQLNGVARVNWIGTTVALSYWAVMEPDKSYMLPNVTGQPSEKLARELRNAGFKSFWVLELETSW